MRAALPIALLALSLTALVPAAQPAAAQTASALYERGVEARLDGRFEAATDLLVRARALEPENADVLVQLGFARLGAEDLAGAREAFEAALAIAPDYADAGFGLALAAFRAGDVGEAGALIEPLVAQSPDNAEFRALRDSVAAARMGADTYRWRLDFGSELSTLSGGRPSWSDSGAALSYRFSDTTSAALRLRHARRGHAHDWQIEGRIDHRATDRLTIHTLAAGAPNAGFLARHSFGGGANLRILDAANGAGPVLVGIDARHDVFAGSRVWTLAPNLQVFVLDGQLAFSGRWIHTRDDRGTVADGYLMRADWSATDRLRLFAGYADAPEISEGRLDDTRTFFTGIAFDIDDRLTLTGHYAHERRATFERHTFGAGLSLRF
jgi:YaiO family outer membrane protein